jgi:hypothetical protein
VPIRSFAFDPALSEACVELRYELHRSDLHWIPPLRSFLRRYYEPGFGFYQCADNYHHHFVAMANGAVIGHVTATIDGNLCVRQGQRIGAVGLFECIDDEAVATDLLDSAIAWLRDEHDVQRVLGPMAFDIWHEYRFKTAGFDMPVFLGEPYNPPRYPEYFLRAGFTGLERWNTVQVTGRQALESLIAPFAGNLQALFREGYRFDQVDRHNPDDFRAVFEVETAAFQDAVAYTRPPFEEYQLRMQAFARIAGTQLVNILRAPDGRAVGLSIVFSDPAKAVRAMHGDDGLAARLRFVLRSRQRDRAIYYFIGAVPAARGRTRGLGRAMLNYTVKQVLDAGYDAIAFALIGSESRGRRILGNVMQLAQSEYTLYERAI